MDPAIPKLLQQQLKLTEERLGAPKKTPSQTKLIMLGEALENSITEFHYDTDVNSTFSTWFARFQDIFKGIFENK